MLLLTVVLVFRLVSASPTKSNYQPTQQEQENTQEIVFRYMMKPIPVPSEFKIQEQFKIRVFFLSVNDKDPSARLLKRFAKFNPPVKKFSDSYIDQHGRVRDKKSNQLGSRCRIKSTEWRNSSKVVVFGGPGGGGTFVLVKRAGRWAVISHKEQVRY
jgi:hypothetical protein